VPVVAIVYVVFLVSPVLLLALGSFGENWSNTLLPTGFTWRWYEEVISDSSFRRAVVNSQQKVGVTIVLNIFVGLPFAYAIHVGAKGSVRLAARLVTQLPVAVPDLVLAFGFILVFSSDALPWLGSFSLLAAGHLVLTLPYTVTALVADMEQLGLAEHEYAASTLGASFGARVRDLVIPPRAPSHKSVAALSIGEFQLSNLISGFLSRTYPVVLLQAFYGATGFACAATIVLLFLAAIASLAGSLTSGFSGSKKAVSA
jgi:putative spermidine/putrescine transport system permease protein